MRRIIFSTITVSAMAVALYAQNSEVITERQALMKQNGASMKLLSQMTSGEVEFDAEAANKAISAIRDTALMLPSLFPEDSMTGASLEGEETEAAPAIWENPEEFAQMTQNYIAHTEEATAMNPQSVEELGAALSVFGGDCRSCHEAFRVDRD